ncbi:hypothetical protein N7495_005291 [Penicillium taxi]|uniref:uncharacterized protein n=1 Tax=Penicillium taxi TaxID=168475 RepID=UPI0025452FFD|nr:uncharacterized protein N7495_005291 [Penicillium taxi]KAJ5893600.1 hypothetical protein N7495_005291 [Penicillium taxi]
MGKEGDQIFLPPSRRNNAPRVSPDWPTFVVETGDRKLRSAAAWWLNQSEGLVRMVLLVSINTNVVDFELWMLAPPNTPRPLPGGYIDALRNYPALLPPTARQLANNQQPYSQCEVEVSANSVPYGPMVLPFEALYDISPLPGSGEIDVVLSIPEFQDFVFVLF